MRGRVYRSDEGSNPYKKRDFFTPLATGDYSGTSGQNQTDAQWIADKLIARGQGTLVILPSVECGISLDNPIVNLIR